MPGADDFLKGLGMPAAKSAASAPAPAAAAPSTDDLLAAFAGGSSVQSQSSAGVSSTTSYSTPGKDWASSRQPPYTLCVQGLVSKA